MRGYCIRGRALKKKLYCKRFRARETRRKVQWHSPHTFTAAAAAYCYSMMMKSSTFFFSFLSRLDPFYPLYLSTCTHNTRFGLIASISHRELLRNFTSCVTTLKKKPFHPKLYSLVTTSAIEVHCPSRARVSVYTYNKVLLTSTSFPPLTAWRTSRFPSFFFFFRYLFFLHQSLALRIHTVMMYG